MSARALANRCERCRAFLAEGASLCLRCVEATDPESRLATVTAERDRLREIVRDALTGRATLAGEPTWRERARAALAESGR